MGDVALMGRGRVTKLGFSVGSSAGFAETQLREVDKRGDEAIYRAGISK